MPCIMGCFGCALAKGLRWFRWALLINIFLGAVFRFYFEQFSAVFALFLTVTVYGWVTTLHQEVVEKNRPIGLLTERDLAVRVLDKNKDLKRLKVSNIMTTPILTVAPDADIYYSSEMMRKNRIKKLPVVRNGILIGIVTQTDILEYFRNLRKKFVLKNLNQKERKSYPIV